MSVTIPKVDIGPVVCRCPTGHTTPSTGSTAAAACSLYAPGWGSGPSGATEPCQLGLYSNGSLPIGQPCLKCPAGRTTSDTGTTSIDGCSLCAAGYGGPSASQCVPCQDGRFGPPAGGSSVRGDHTRCLSCPTGTAFSFPDWNGNLDVFSPSPTSPVGATSASDCLAEFSQTVEGPFFLDLKPNHPDFPAIPGAETLAACVSYCSEDDACAAITFNYQSTTCSAWKPAGSTSSSAGTSKGLAASGGLALGTVLSSSAAEVLAAHKVKAAEGAPVVSSAELDSTAVNSTDTDSVNDAHRSGPSRTDASKAGSNLGTGTAEPSVRQLLQNTVHASSMGSGYYTFWPGAGAAAAVDGASLVDEGGVATLNDCLWACTVQTACAGVVFGPWDAATDAIGAVPGGSGIRCQRIQGRTEAGARRTLIRAKFTALSPMP